MPSAEKLQRRADNERVREHVRVEEKQEPRCPICNYEWDHWYVRNGIGVLTTGG